MVQKTYKIRLQKTEIENKHTELLEQIDKLAQQPKDILEDIRYSKRIQKAIFPTDETLHEQLSDFFILNMPRNIVSGDFYWAGKIDNWCYRLNRTWNIRRLYDNGWYSIFE